MDLDAPAGDADLLDDEAQETSAAFDVEVVERVGDLLSETGESLAQPVLGRQFGAAARQGVPLLSELVAPGCDRGSSLGELVEFEQAGLVGVEQPGAFAFVVLDRAVEPFELGGDELVLVGWRAGDHCALGGDQLPRVEQRLADLRKDVFVQLVGADVALGAATHA